MLKRVAKRYDAWATGIRRDQSPTRADTPIVRWDKKFGLVKISPLAAWTKSDVWRRILRDGIPYNPLHDQAGTRPTSLSASGPVQSSSPATKRSRLSRGLSTRSTGLVAGALSTLTFSACPTKSWKSSGTQM